MTQNLRGNYRASKTHKTLNGATAPFENMKRILLGLGLILALLAVPNRALADSFGFSYVSILDSSIVAGGTLTTGVFDAGFGGFGGWEVTGITGDRNGVAIVGLVPNPNWPSSNIQFNIQYDNGMLSTFALTSAGILYELADGSKWNFYHAPYPGYLEVPIYSYNEIPITLQLWHIENMASVPETATTFSLLIAAFLGMVYVRRFGAGVSHGQLMTHA